MFKSIKRLLCINGWFCIEGSDINLVSHSEYGLMKKTHVPRLSENLVKLSRIIKYKVKE